MVTNNFVSILIGNETLALRAKYIKGKDKFLADACVKYQLAKIIGDNALKDFFFDMEENYITNGFLTVEESALYKNKTKELHDNILFHYGNETLDIIIKKYFLI